MFYLHEKMSPCLDPRLGVLLVFGLDETRIIISSLVSFCRSKGV